MKKIIFFLLFIPCLAAGQYTSKQVYDFIKSKKDTVWVQDSVVWKTLYVNKAASIDTGKVFWFSAPYQLPDNLYSKVSDSLYFSPKYKTWFKFNRNFRRVVFRDFTVEIQQKITVLKPQIQSKPVDVEMEELYKLMKKHSLPKDTVLKVGDMLLGISEYKPLIMQ